MSWKYEDILHCDRPVPVGRAPMSLYDRAAQFSPFAALTGYEDTIAETARLTDARTELDADAVGDLDRKLRDISAQIAQHPRITVRYFRPDQRKPGGSYVTVMGNVKKIDPIAQVILLSDGETLDFSGIYEIDG